MCQLRTHSDEVRRAGQWILCTLSLLALLAVSPSFGQAPQTIVALPRGRSRIRVDALEAGSWNGIAMVVDDQTAFQVRVGAEAEFGDYLDGDNGPDFLKESFNN